MSKTGIEHLVSQLGFQSPTLLVYLVGLVAGIAFWHRNPRASRLAVLGLGLLLTNSLASAATDAYLREALLTGNRPLSEYSWRMSLLGIGFSLGHAAGIALLVTAVFIGRGRRSTEISTESPAPPAPPQPRSDHTALVVIIPGLFLLACVCPAVQMAGEGFSLLGDWNEVHRGVTALLLGWLSHSGLPWLANLLLAAGWFGMMVRAYHTAALLGASAFALGLTTAFQVVEPYKIVPPDTGITGLFAGYYLWQASMLVLACGAEWLAFRRWMRAAGQMA